MFTNQQINFRLIKCPTCKHLTCWINSRLPIFCPECGIEVYRRLCNDVTGEFILFDTAEAWLRVSGRLEGVLDSEHIATPLDASKKLQRGNQNSYNASNISSRSGGDKK